MARRRTKKYYDVFLTESDMKKLAQGKSVNRQTDGIGIAIATWDNKKIRKIAKLEAQLRALKGEKRTKRPYKRRKGWTMAARKKLSESMKRVHAERKHMGTVG